MGEVGSYRWVEEAGLCGVLGWIGYAPVFRSWNARADHCMQHTAGQVMRVYYSYLHWTSAANSTATYSIAARIASCEEGTL